MALSKNDRTDLPPVEEEETLAEKAERLATVVAEDLDADIYLFSGPIRRPLDASCIEACMQPNRRGNAFLIISTYGGDPDAAYRIARSFHRSYKSLTVCINGDCASAGTLIALGATELVLSDYAVLGPLDMQIAKADELWVMSSGLTGQTALDAIRQSAFETFEQTLIQLKQDLPNQVSLRTSMDVAVRLTTGLFEQVYAQVDPFKLGEDRRALEVAEHYGKRLAKRSANLKPETLQNLLVRYPSHSFVIDREEAKELFHRVREPSQNEVALLDMWPLFSRRPSENPIFTLLSTVKKTEDNNEHARRENNVGNPEGGVATNGQNFDAKAGSAKK